MERKFNRRVLAWVLCLALMLTGCGAARTEQPDETTAQVSQQAAETTAPVSQETAESQPFPRQRRTL